ncbi:Hypothetical predicted protein [Pelobates cultripes]|uniref:Uncharacterized protein n=1 Tax=Pelobates cultripes TaxID=61616 RepID=A0AAD1SGW6_PELCU|nr:Hypothetical predicted protein [Pelobates cultripes]
MCLCSLCLWKRAKAQLDSESDLSEIEEETCMDTEDPLDPESDDMVEDNDPRERDTPQYDSYDMELKAPYDVNKHLDPYGEPLFDPDDLRHPRSAEWSPSTHVAKYIASRICKPLNKATLNKLRAECPRPTIPDNACRTSAVDPKIIPFLSKTG